MVISTTILSQEFDTPPVSGESNYCNKKYCNKYYNKLSYQIIHLYDSVIFPLRIKTKKAWTDIAQAFLVDE
jgi:hypothetical protein